MVKLNEKVDELKKAFILDAASKYFKEFGYEKTQIDKISKELGIGVGTIYGHFKSKEGLFLAWLASIIDKAHIELVDYSKSVESASDKLTKVVEYKFEYFEKNKTTIKGYLENNQLFLRGISRRKEHPMEKVYIFCADIIKQIKSMNDEDAYLLANIFDGIINSYIECSDDVNLMHKKDEVMKRFLRLIEV